MKYCSHCGKELLDEAVVCPGCGCKAPSKEPTIVIDEDDKNVYKLIIKILMIISCIATGLALIPLIWKIPMTMHACRKLKNNEPMGVGFKVCVLIFVSRVAGIMLLLMDEINDL